MRCPINGCNAFFVNQRSLKSHQSKIHNGKKAILDNSMRQKIKALMDKESSAKALAKKLGYKGSSMIWKLCNGDLTGISPERYSKIEKLYEEL